MKYTKTTIRELSARYRGILKKCFLLNALALGLFAATAAKADTGVWQTAINGTDAFMDNLELAGWNRGTDPVTGWGVDQILAVMAPAATATDEAIAKLNSIDYEVTATDPDKKGYTFTAPNGEAADLTATGITADSYVADSVADTTDGVSAKSGTVVKHDTGTLTAANYTYVSYDKAGATTDVSGEVAVSELTDTFTSSKLANYKEITASSAESGVVAIADYKLVAGTTTFTITYDPTEEQYTLLANGVATTDFPGVKSDLVEAYESDMEALAERQTELKGYYDDSVANRNKITAAETGVLAQDQAKVNQLYTWEGEFVDAGSDYTADKDTYDSQVTKYETSLSKVIDDKANSAVNATVGDMHAVTVALKGDSYEGDDLTVSGAFQEVMTQAETIFSQKQQWVDDTLGIESAKKDAVKKAYADTNYLTETTTLTGADKALDAQIKTNANAIALKANAADVYTKAEAEAIFYEKQQWVDDTLGIESSKKDAVKTAYSGTNYLTTTTTLTGADIVLDGQIKTINNTLGEGFDTGDNTVAKVITAKANAAESNAKEYAKGYTDTVVAGLDAELSQAAGTDGLALSITEVDGKITAISGSIAANTYDAYGAAGTAETNAKNYTDSKIETLSGEVDDTVGDLSSLEDLAFFKGKAKTAGAGAADVGDSSVTELLTNLNDNLSSEFARVDRRIDKLETKLEKGLAANNALAGLVPLDHVHKTQVSAALGGYKNNQALAVGAFHYLNDRTLLNAGAAYGGNDSVSYKVGVTFGF